MAKMSEKRSGEFKPTLTGELRYYAFCPRPLPPKLILDEAISNLSVTANCALAKLETLGAYLPNMNLFIAMYVRKEALLSSQIEGTQATLDDILDPQIKQNANQDIFDVINYIKAINFATKRLKKLPLCNRLLLETHAILLRGQRGSAKNAGEFRRSQNWIGGVGSTLKNARYIPPAPPEMRNALSDLEKYINHNSATNPLIKAALIHYQFETIHPFLDGNGRIGRLLVNLFLQEQKILSRPLLYLSYFLKRNRVEYYDRLNEVREKGNFEQWIKFFLTGIEEAANDAIETINALLKLHTRNLKTIIAHDTRTNILQKLFALLEQTPIIEIKTTAQKLGLAYNTIDSAVKKLRKLKILQPTEKKQRDRCFAYETYLAILRRGTE